MSTEERKVFDIEEQEVKDVSSVIKTITPVISIIREWGKEEKEFKAVQEKSSNLLCEIDAIDRTINVFDDKTSTIYKVLVEECNKRTDRYNKLEGRRINLQKLCSNLEKEVVSYRNYARLFNWVTDGIIDGIRASNLIESEEECLTLLFFMHNIYTPYETGRAAIKCYLASKGMNPERLNLEWNDFLKYLKNT